MAVESSYTSILGGVSQQVFKDRQPSQVSLQMNMLSDLVRGLRRRPGTRRVGYTEGIDLRGSNDTLAHYSTDMGFGSVTLLVDTVTGRLFVIDEVSTVANQNIADYIAQNDYWKATTSRSIRFATVGADVYIANTERKPGTSPRNEANPRKLGFYFIRTGAFSKNFTINIEHSGGTASFNYLTPNGTDPSHAAQATPESIANTLVQQMIPSFNYPGGITFARTGAYVYMVSSGGDITVTSNSGSNYITASRQSTVPDESQLPATLPASASGYIVGVGDSTFKKYFQYRASEGKWVEHGAFGSPLEITNAPKRVAYNGSWGVDTGNWPGREAGDDDTNPVPKFVEQGVTGMGSFQGRLVLLAGPYICMSSAGPDKTRNFFRETVTSLLVSDPINVASASATGANFQYATPYNADLVIHAAGHQAVIPSRGQAVTPQNATVVLTTSYEASLSAEPKPVGRSLFYTAPRSPDTFAVMEMFPSGFTESQYDSQDVTNHIPDYLRGRCRGIATSSTNNVCVFLSSSNLGELIVHEYLWAGDEKVHSAWHKWEFTSYIYAAWFVRETLNLLVQHPDSARAEVIQLSLRTAAQPDSSELYLPAMDYLVKRPVLAQGSLEPYVQLTEDSDQWYMSTEVVACAMAEGDYVGSFVGVKSYDPATKRLYLQPTYPTGSVWLGNTFESAFSPTPPVVRDRQDKYIGTNKATIVRYLATLRYTAPFEVSISDRGGSVLEDFYGAGVSYTSQELGLMNAPLAERFKLVIPCRIELESGVVTFKTRAVGDMNIQGLDYVLRLHRRVRRL